MLCPHCQKQTYVDDMDFCEVFPCTHCQEDVTARISPGRYQHVVPELANYYTWFWISISFILTIVGMFYKGNWAFLQQKVIVLLFSAGAAALALPVAAYYSRNAFRWCTVAIILAILVAFFAGLA